MKLKYVSNDVVDFLRSNIAAHYDRYLGGDFADVQGSGDWGLQLKLEVDLKPLSDLDPAGSPEVEANNSLLVWRALGSLPASLAYEEGIWVRLTHVESLGYCRARWLVGLSSIDATERAIKTHFFAATLTARRDDNAISRLWWNAYIANRIQPSDVIGALRGLLRKADIRMQLVERSNIGSRAPLCRGILRAMKGEARVAESEDGFRDFMKEVNKRGGGVIFEALTHEEVDRFLAECWAASIQNSLRSSR
jgi:hypothetical protein